MNYNPYLFDEEMTCEVQVTLRIDDYAGHVWYKHMGEAGGKQALDFDFESCDGDMYHNDCGLSYDEETDAFCAELKNPKGKTMAIEMESPEFMNRLITAVEITDCYKERSCYTCEEWDEGFEKCNHLDQYANLAEDYMAGRDHCCDLWKKEEINGFDR